MKKFLDKYGITKYQVIFFASLLGLVALTIVLAGVTSNQKTKPPVNETPDIIEPSPNKDLDPVVIVDEETVKLPLDSNSNYEIVRKFYEKDDTKENQIKSLIKYNTTFRTSQGVSYSVEGKTFPVNASLSGKVIESKLSPIFGNYVIIEVNSEVKTYYYGLDEVNVKLGDEVKQGSTIGTAGKTSVDSETGIHVFFQIEKNNKFINPEKAIGKKLSQI